MKLQCYSDNAYSILKSAVDRYEEDMKEYYHQKNPWSIAFIEKNGGEGNLYFTVDSHIPDFELTGKPSAEGDIDNCIILYNALRNLPPAHAANPKIWAYLCHETFYKYMTERWDDDIRTRFFITGNGARSLYRNGLSRLWWISHMTYDDQRDDPYELTRVLLRRQDDMENILGRNLNLNKKILHCLLDVLGTMSISEYNRNVLRDMMIDVNRMGGVSVLDALPDDKLKLLFERKCAEHLKSKK